MKKTVLTLLSFMLLSSAAMFGSERVLYKFVATTTSSTSIAGKASAGESEYSAVDVSAYCFEIGNSASAEYYNNGSTGEMFKRDSVRLANTDSYLHISLARPLSVGDVIAVKSKQTDKVYFSHTSTRARVALVNDDLTFTVPSGSKLVGTTDLYMWRDNNTIYIHELVITTTSEEVAYYDFEDETITDFSSAQTYTLDNGLKLNSNGASTHNTISSVSEKGYTKMLYIVGNGANRSLMLEVTDPCTIEVWGRSSSSSARNLFISEGSYAQTTKVLSDVTNTALTRGTYSYTGFEDSKTLYISPDGGFYIAAIRVVYDRIRPAASFSVTPASAVIRQGENQVFTYNKDYSGATISRGKKEGEAAWISVSESANTSVTVSPQAAGIGHTYVMRLTQVADAYCRQAVVDVPIRIIAANETLEDIIANEGTLSDKIWTSDDNITLADDAAEYKNIAKYSAVGEFAANTSFRLAAGKDYTISVPSNKQISRVTFSGYTVQEGTGGITVNEVTTNFNANGEEKKDIQYDNINNQKFTFRVRNKNVAVKIAVATTDLGYYPVTITGGWASFCAPEDVELPAGVDAYIVNDRESDVLYIENANISKVPANTGVLLFSEDDGDYNLTATTGAEDLSSGFVGTTARTANPNTTTTYSLYNNSGTIEFWNYTGAYIPANKAYLVYGTPSGAPAKKLRVQVAPKTPTAIDEVQSTNMLSTKRFENGQIVIIRDGIKYNVQGQIVK